MLLDLKFQINLRVYTLMLISVLVANIPPTELAKHGTDCLSTLKQKEN